MGDKPKRFKIGDEVTYLDRKLLPGGKYQFGGDNQKGFVGKIINYYGIVVSKGCYEIRVEANGNRSYTMLECEFAEYYTTNNYEIF